jgi:hypothetical protein
MSNWAENPQNHRQSLYQYALPHLLFTECQKYCVADEFHAATTPAETTCIANCQEKTRRSFDLYMAVSERVAARKNFRSYVDISRFTGMEVEHKHDTESVIQHYNDGHVHPAQVAEFTKQADKQYGDIQKKALL